MKGAPSPAAVESLDSRPKRRFLIPRFIVNEWAAFRRLGLKGYVKKRGALFFVLVVSYYLVRDVTLYIIIPYLVIRGVIQCPGSAAS